jgi:hypothetical protein
MLEIALPGIRVNPEALVSALRRTSRAVNRSVSRLQAAARQKRLHQTDRIVNLVATNWE